MAKFKNKTNKIISIGNVKMNPGETLELSESSSHVKAFVTLKWLAKVLEEKTPPKVENKAHKVPIAPVVEASVPVVEVAAPVVEEELAKPKRRKKTVNETDSISSEATPDSGEPEVTGPSY